MCVGGQQFLYEIGISTGDLCTPALKISGVDNYGLRMLGVVFMAFMGRNPRTDETRETRQMVYIAEGVNQLFLSLDAIKQLGIVSPSFPQVAEFNNISEQGPGLDGGSVLGSSQEGHLC